jgi:nucleoside-diphosphate-sugar epimerase
MTTPVVLITGALTGIGRAAALAFARDGNRIVVSGRHEEAGQGLATELRALGAEAHFVRADVRHEDDVRELSTGQSLVLAGSMPPSTTPAPKAIPARSPSSRPTAIPPPSTPMSSGHCSA